MRYLLFILVKLYFVFKIFQDIGPLKRLIYKIIDLLFNYERFHPILIKNVFQKWAPSNKTPALTKSMNMDYWVFGESNQLFIRAS